MLRISEITYIFEGIMGRWHGNFSANISARRYFCWSSFYKLEVAT